MYERLIIVLLKELLLILFVSERTYTVFVYKSNIQQLILSRIRYIVYVK